MSEAAPTPADGLTVDDEAMFLVAGVERGDWRALAHALAATHPGFAFQERKSETPAQAKPRGNPGRRLEWTDDKLFRLSMVAETIHTASAAGTIPGRTAGDLATDTALARYILREARWRDLIGIPADTGPDRVRTMLGKADKLFPPARKSKT